MYIIFPVSDSAVKNYITSLQEQYHITREQLQEMFKMQGTLLSRGSYQNLNVCY